MEIGQKTEVKESFQAEGAVSADLPGRESPAVFEEQQFVQELRRLLAIRAQGWQRPSVAGQECREVHPPCGPWEPSEGFSVSPPSQYVQCAVILPARRPFSAPLTSLL